MELSGVEKRGTLETIRNKSREDQQSPTIGFGTKALHTHLPREKWDGSRCVARPITLTSTYLMSTPEEQPDEWLYGRYGNPSRDQVELTLAALEGDAKYAVCFSSGMAAANALLEAILGRHGSVGDHVVAIRQVLQIYLFL